MWRVGTLERGVAGAAVFGGHIARDCKNPIKGNLWQPSNGRIRVLH